ncbi:SCO6880 family protein [Rothia nasimurium]|uniref:SCO6880 family protein n=1 Tax=Rothia nasimurium TaxID=85336 RepID=UPI003BA33A48
MSQQNQERIRYGNIIIPPNSGWLGVPKEVSNFGLGAIFVAFGVYLIGSRLPFLGTGLTFLVTLGIILIAAIIIFLRLRKGAFGRYKWEEKKMMKLFKKAKAQGYTSYRPGPSSNLPDGSFRLPGLLAGTQNHQYTNSFHVPYGLIWDPERFTGTVFFSVAVPGLQLMDQEDIDRMVAQFAAFHREAGISASIIQIAAKVVTTKDSGTRLPMAVAKQRSIAGDRDIPLTARTIMDEVLEIENQELPKVEHHVSLTFSARPVVEAGLPARSKEELAEEISTIIHGFVNSISEAAGGVTNLMDSQSITDHIYVMYNPDKSMAVDQAKNTAEGTGLLWEEVGPTYHEVEKDWYEHSGYYSKSFQMWKPPAALFYEDSMKALLSPEPLAERKVVTLLYRPLSNDVSSKLALEIVDDAYWDANQKGKKGGSRSRTLKEKAERTEAEMAHGATLVPFGLVVTVTTDDPKKFPRLAAETSRKATSGINLRLREATYSHDAAFALGLGLGLTPRDFKLKG